MHVRVVGGETGGGLGCGLGGNAVRPGWASDSAACCCLRDGR